MCKLKVLTVHIIKNDNNIIVKDYPLELWFT